MASWNLLDEKSESDIHKTRLLNVEERPFKRITKRLGVMASHVSKITDQASPSPQDTTPSSEQAQLKEDLILDFAAFDSIVTRLQFLHDANFQERERYQADQERILGECQAARTNNDSLKEQLEVAKGTLAQRKEFDELAEKITSNRLLKPRDEQIANLAKLEEECKELERESDTYNETWKERREQFSKIMDEGMLLRRQIRDEKEEVDRREGMNEGADDEEAGERAGQTPRHEPAGDATPRPDGDAKGDGTPRLQPLHAESTSLRNTPDPDSLRVRAPGSASPQTRPGSPDVTPLPHLDGQKTEREDVQMEDPRHLRGKLSEDRGETPSDMIEARSAADSMEVDG